ncbi:MAG TPA: hypothetical protein VEK08_10635 [Planctomycetota bacterium]|nr:hypothetical protein [Planctomycetota bacterium]
MGIPTNYIKKRDLLHSEKSSPAVLSRTAREFLALERYSDALDFFEKANDSEGIAEIKKIALAGGDTFLLARLDRFNAKWVNPEDWQQAASKAEAAGKPSMATFVARKMAAANASAAAKAAEMPGEAPLAEV